MSDHRRSRTGSDTNPQPWVPSDSHIGDTLGDAGYDPSVFKYPTPNTDNLIGHPAVRKHGQGVSSGELANFTECLASMAQSRVMGTGREQYAIGPGQEFEVRTPYQMAEYMLEELADVINYASMSAIKVLALIRAMEGVKDA